MTSTYKLIAATHAGKSMMIGSKKLTLRISTAAIAKPLNDVQRGQRERRTIIDVASMNTPATFAA